MKGIGTACAGAVNTASLAVDILIWLGKAFGETPPATTGPCGNVDGLLHEEGLPYGWRDSAGRPDQDVAGAEQAGAALKMEEMDSAALLDIVRKASDILRRRGIRTVETGAPRKLRITKDYRIFIPELGNREISLMPLPKMLFIFFLRHPEGVAFTGLDRYKDELMDIYVRISPRLDRRGMQQSIERIVSPESNSFHAQKSKLSSALSSYFEGSALGKYVISQKDGGGSSISLRPGMVIWE